MGMARVTMKTLGQPRLDAEWGFGIRDSQTPASPNSDARPALA